MDEGKCTLRMQLKKGVQNGNVANPGVDLHSKKKKKKTSTIDVVQSKGQYFS